MGRKAKALGARLWELIEAPQGYAYLSDDMEEWGPERDAEAVKRAISALMWHQECVKKLKGFIQRNDC